MESTVWAAMYFTFAAFFFIRNGFSCLQGTIEDDRTVSGGLRNLCFYGHSAKQMKGEIFTMGYKSDIEIAQECEMLPITEIAKKAGIDDKYLEQYGKYKAKIDYNLLKETDKE